ncbi:helix-turn-helix domain-containing protein [Mucilaginibacter sp. L196]|uniref:helix-turn-helix domain-containing protein n=1 Tax=Mucilaginibacter sp. L196 TaxID=1641870 RepID=UPI00131CFBBE|nr:helix-turn-helix transcriptional regulator [Mucilaginibacter sp. L196]
MKDETLLFRIKFGLRIKELRIIKKIDQASLAAELNKDKQFINRYENEGANPRADIVQDLAKVLGLKSIDELYDFSNLKDEEVKDLYEKIKGK